MFRNRLHYSQTCAAAKLAATILEKDEDEVRQKVGLPPLDPPRFCLCGNEVGKGRGSRGLCASCRRVEVVCTECGKHFSRQRSRVFLAAARHKYTFCSNPCKWAYVGRSKKGKRMKHTKKTLNAFA